MTDITEADDQRPSLPLDPCSAPPSFSFSRFLLFLPIFLMMLPGSVSLFIWLNDPFDVYVASLLGYTGAVILYTFSANRGLTRYLFTCPVVHKQLLRLALRYMAFVAILFSIETVGLALRPHLPKQWLATPASFKAAPPFADVLLFLGACLVLAHIFSNRSLLKQAHAKAGLLPRPSPIR